MADDAETKDTIEYLLTSAEFNGVGAVSVSDGTVLCFSAETLRALLERAESSEDKRAVVYVKHQQPDKLS